MIQRLIDLPDDHSFFLFGARGTGKTFLLRNHFKHLTHLWIDFLDPEQEARYSLEPILLLDQIKELNGSAWIVLDEVQKVPKILNIVHKAIEESTNLFALSGSSARKLPPEVCRMALRTVSSVLVSSR